MLVIPQHRALAFPLFSYPLKVACERLILEERLGSVEARRQCHLVILAVNAPMALPTNRQPDLQSGLIEMLLKTCAAMHLLGNEMMECQGHLTLAAATGTPVSSVACQLCGEGSAASIAAVISSLSGVTPLPKCSSTSPLGDTRYLLKFQRG